MKQDFYVYLLLDPRNWYSPFYVGKGKGTRAKTHLYEKFAARDNNRLKQSVIQKIRNVGLEPTVMIWEDSLAEDRAFELEKELIERFGRRLDGGILTNISVGGRGGTSGYRHTEAARKARSEAMRGEHNFNFGRSWEEQYGVEGAAIRRAQVTERQSKPQAKESNAKRSEKLRGIKRKATTAGRKFPNRKRRAPLTTEEVLAIYQEVGVTNKDICIKYNVSYVTVSNIRNGLQHASITGHVRD